ncbi:PilZ domain-containing protein [Azospira restricta]|uniref:Cyclic diguanosine monophosphate-binding protein n=1 Tax=Azospira restricta TaxID=404405 RepID=A0A974Y4S5_9RHOO|nr:PilZ domain-containing protein [Azospira restricta]QRJ64773.1 PilZ domain-containing protein [Azospira restricta]
MTASNRRQFSRIAFHAPGQLVCGGGQDEVAVVDLSLRGALLRHKGSGPQPGIGDNCVLHVRLGQLDALIRMQGTVAHLDGPFLGLACHSIDLDSATHLRRLVELNLGDTALLERELAALVGED